MLPLTLTARPDLTVLALGAHADDVEIGCGGTLLRILEDCPGLRLWWVVLSAPGRRAEEARLSAEAFLRTARNPQVIVEQFEDGYFPYHGADLKRRFERLKGAVSPDLIFTHYRQDRHQDHRLVSELTWNTFRDHLVLEYEIPKYDGDLGSPNVFVQLSEALCRKKVCTIVESFPSQHGKHWFDAELFFSILRLRGMEACAPSRHAEAFYGPKVVL